MPRTGREALQAVGEAGGDWNWALVGPDPEELPLAGGGWGSCDDIRKCVEGSEHLNLFGALRLDFGAGKQMKRKFVFIHASRVDERSSDDKGPSVRRHGQGMAQQGAMEKALSAFAKFAVTFEAKSLQDLELEAIIAKVHKASTADAEMITSEAYREAIAELEVQRREKQEERAERSEEAGDEQEAQPDIREAISEEAGRSSSSSGLCRGAADEEVAPRAEPQVEYRQGDLIQVFSKAAKDWIDDGTVYLVLDRDGYHDGVQLPKGAVKALYNKQQNFKWVLPSYFPMLLRPSYRPSAPHALVGELMKEHRDIFTRWVVRHCELTKGFLQWWVSADVARKGRKPNRSLELYGLELSKQGTVIYLRVEACQEIFKFDAQEESSCKMWLDSLKRHEEYCARMRAYTKR